MANTPTIFLFGRKAAPYIVQPIYDENGLFKSQATALKFDCAFDETHTIKNEISAFPIENGLDIADHIRQLPDKLSITGFVTNSPISYLAYAQSGSNRVQSAYDTLMRLAGRKNTKLVSDIDSILKPVVVDIFTTFRFWLNMVIVSMSVKRAPDTGDAIEFSLELEAIRKIAVNLANVNYSDTSRSGGAGGIDDQLTAKTEAGSKEKQKVAPRTDSFLKIGSGSLNASIQSMKNGLLNGIGQ